MLDVNLKEDDLRNRVAGGAESVSVIRRFTLNLVRLQSKKYSVGAEAKPSVSERHSSY
ncbi:hypothetical protein QNE77_004055 [Vibrio alginolyticus]|uniref:hypothetical protein n=1 Tax=Vibrio TaxID=662 RepID=UPI0021CEC3C5|nr:MULTISPECIES: hypothetical protein [unclassified Vibrio]EIL2910949.1 hypothetical protein [Vibrio alginolyticus]EIL8370390.1 hypothetical protein [Vibrio alginolyticus]EJE8156717.1 hypothetical protein [Vibrio alginolyticus]EJX1242638.1 hypothetical protein [Vibrio alginolyticus]ELA8261943.1 hypothetical protein [Vibrio alginolyticus]